MLNPNKDRLDYGTILTPPQNYELDFAIATTYSLDLGSLVSASISLGLSQEVDSGLMENPIFLLEALRRVGNNMALFCEAGQIHLPSKITNLYILLEEIVYQVKRDSKKTPYPSFHPKFWLLRFKNKENKIKYRIIILSRNLTFDRSWDISFTMDGEIKEKTDKNDSIIAFLKYLTNFIQNKEKTDKINQIIEELPFIKFDLAKPFYDYDFMVEGISNEFSIKNYPLFDKNKSFDELLIMSPFLSNSIIKEFNLRESNDSILITRKSSLAKLNKKDSNNFKIYTLKDEIIDGESLIDNDSLIENKQDIHSKMYIIKDKNLVDIYLGSLNASHNALNGNVEFMVRLRKKGGFNKLVEDILNKDSAKSPFELVNMDNIQIEDNEDNDNLDSIIKEIIRLNPKGKIIEKYNMELRFKPFSSNFNIEIRPLLLNKFKKLSEKIIFNNLEKLELSEFIVIRVSNNEKQVERVIKIPIENMPNRKDELITSIVSSEEKFINYVTFLLEDDIFSIISTNNSLKENTGLNNSDAINMNGLYEKMLKTSYKDPSKLNEINYLIKTISKDGIIPEGFDKLYKTFKSVVD